jgi:hypothetical protein
MPHKTESAKVLENLQNQILGSVISNVVNDINSITNSSNNTTNSTSSDSDDESPNNFVLYGLLQAQWYFKYRIHTRPDSSHLANDVLQMPLEKFRIKFRMSPAAFERIWGMIANHPAFYNNSNSPQFDPRW